VPAHTFVPTQGGQLADISVLLQQNGAAPSQFVFELRPTLAGVPSAAVLATATVDATSESATPALFTADFTLSNVTLLAGTAYAVSVRAIGGLGSGASIVGDISNGYTPGAEFVSFDSGTTWMPADQPNNYDVGFRVGVVPEPSTWMLVILGLGTPAILHRAGRRLMARNRRYQAVA
jgi:hypothetical protein